VDTTPPSVPVVTDDGAVTHNLTQLHATFVSTEDVSQVTGYRYCIGTYQGGQDVRGWTDVPTGTATATGLTLVPGTTYYFAVRAKNSVNLWSTTGYSDGILAQVSLPPPVPDGSFGQAAKFSKIAGSGSQVHVTWDAALCTAPAYGIYYGSLSTVSGYTLSGSQCGIGITGAYDWTSAVPAGNVYFLIVANDGASTEGSWGTDYIGGVHHQIRGTTPSNQCGTSAHDNGGTCP
jgi:hypothetical protein